MKNILFLSYDFPYPSNSGGKIRVFNLIKHGLKKHNVFLFSFAREKVENSRINAIKEIGVKKVRLIPRKKVLDIRNFSLLSTDSIFKKLYYSKRVDEELYSFIIQNNVDTLICESYYTSFYLYGFLKTLKIKKIFGTENIEHKIYSEYVKSNRIRLLNKLFTREVGKIKKEEILALNSADLVLAVNNQEKSEFEKLTSAKTAVIENGVDLKTFTYSWVKREGFNLLFVGNFSYFPNREAIKRFYKDVFVNLGNKNIRLKIIGAHVNRLGINDNRVEMAEYVKNIQEDYIKADIFIFPIKIGGGTNFKILEAMAVGLPIVAYPERVEIIGAKNGTHFLGCRNAQEFLEGIEKVFSDKDFATKLSKNARQLVEENYSWDVIGQKLSELI